MATFGDTLIDDYKHLPADMFHVKLLNVGGNFKETMQQRYAYLHDQESIPKGKKEAYRKSLNDTQLSQLSTKNKKNKSKQIDAQFKQIEQKQDNKLNDRLNAIISKKGGANGK